MKSTNLKKQLPKKFFLYIIVDKDACAKRGIFKVVSRIKLPNTVIQFRDKTGDKADILRDALRLKKICAKNKTVFIINDYLDIAKMVDADGLHLGQSDLPIGFASRLLGPNKIIGISCHNLAQAKQAQKSGADYIGIGPIFKTPTKPDYKPVGLKTLRSVTKNITLPVLAIGGINRENIRAIKQNNADGACVVRAVCRAKNINQAIKELLK